MSRSKLLTVILTAALMLQLITVAVFPQAFNPNNGCITEVTVKKAPSDVVLKDGIIDVVGGEYVEIELNRDPDTTDAYLGFTESSLFEAACQFLNNVHFYISWDEVHGLNVAVEATLLETPANTCTIDGNPTYADKDYPGDEFLFQFGMAFSIFPDNSSDIGTLYRGISKNTETGELLYGYYSQNGVKGDLTQTALEDYNVIINGNTVTYEISFPMDQVTAADTVAGTEILFDISTTGGSQGIYQEDNETYAVGIGDGGFLSAWTTYEAPSHAFGVFSDEPTVNTEAVDTSKLFSDVKENGWYKEAVDYVVTKGLMEGKSDTEFAPTKGMTRAELVTVLYRMAGKPEAAYSAKFSDVAEGKWFTDAIMWAAENDIVGGFSDGTFRPNDGLTRDQLAKIMYQHTLLGGDVSAEGDLSVYPDRNSIQSWAEPFLKWAVGEGILSGKKSGDDTILAPKAATTRAEVATIMMRLGA